MDISSFGIASVAAITVICYLIGAGLKAWPKFSDNQIPVLMGLCGALLGVVGFRIMPDFPAADFLTAIAVGIVSGFAATGINQVFKQMGKED